MNLTKLVRSCFVQQRTPTFQIAKCLLTQNSLSPNCRFLSSCISRKLQTGKSQAECRSLVPSASGVSRLLSPNSQILNTVRTYKAKDVLTLRCKGCYFERRKERLYVECTLKPRHKQMKKLPKWKLYKNDYSEGKVSEACWWKFRIARYYQQGKTQFTNFNWLGDRLGKEI